jgi:hypothetical protein
LESVTPTFDRWIVGGQSFGGLMVFSASQLCGGFLVGATWAAIGFWPVLPFHFLPMLSRLMRLAQKVDWSITLSFTAIFTVPINSAGSMFISFAPRFLELSLSLSALCLVAISDARALLVHGSY